MSTPTGYDYLCVLDFEATCDDSRKFPNQEIIEFPIVAIDARTTATVAEFHKYVKPVWNPILTKFYTELTGIQQATVDPAEPFPEVFEKVQLFVEKEVIGTGKSLIFVTCGDWDLKTMLPAQTGLSGLKTPGYFRNWINIKVAFGTFYKQRRPMGMTDMLHELEIPLIGRHHSGIDDARNIASVMVAMLKQGYVPCATTVNEPSLRLAPNPGTSSSRPAPASKKGPPPTLGDSGEFPPLGETSSSHAKGKGKEKAQPSTSSPAGPSASASAVPKQQARPPKQDPGKGKQKERNPEETYDGSVYASSHLIDIGANLDHKSFEKDLHAMLQRGLQAGVKNIVTLGASVHSSLRCQAICKNYEDSGVKVNFTAGVHPHDAKTCTQDTITQLTRMASDPNMVAIGECGLDFDRNFSPPDVQEKWFEEQVKLAILLKKPLYLHERAAHAALVRILSKHREQLQTVPVVVHCFTGPIEELQTYVSMGFYIGITGWICDAQRGGDLRNGVPFIPLDRLMIETDAPFLIPKNIRPRPSQNEPYYLGRVAETLAQCLGLSVATVIEKSTQNAIRFFSLLKK